MSESAIRVGGPAKAVQLMTTVISQCKSCASSNLIELNSAICLHSTGTRGLTKDAIFAFPKLVVCLDCGATQLTLSAAELQLVRERGARTFSLGGPVAGISAPLEGST